jgi:hypothetical protein
VLLLRGHPAPGDAGGGLAATGAVGSLRGANR